MDSLFEPKKKRELPDLNIVPILDMLVCIIFFLLLSTTFVRLTHQSVPPSAVSTITDPIAPPPLSARVLLYRIDGKLELKLQWVGAEPGENSRTLEPTSKPEEIFLHVNELLGEFRTKFPQERTLQVGLGPDLPYQYLVSIMDGARPYLPDIVLFSYDEVLARSKAGAGGV